MPTKKKKKEQTIVVLAQFTYVAKGEKNFLDPKEVVEKVNAGFVKLAATGTQPWDDVIVTKAKVFERS